jgi:hypothetical protein
VSNARLAEMSAVELEISTDVAQLYYGIQTTYQLIELWNESRAVAAFAVQAHEARAARGLESRTELEAAHGRWPVSGNASTKRCSPNCADAADSDLERAIVDSSSIRAVSAGKKLVRTPRTGASSAASIILLGQLPILSQS